MILPIGNKSHLFFLKKAKKKNAFSFIEVMVTIGILSFGLILIYKAFFVSLRYLHHLNCRFYANSLLDNKIVNLQKRLEAQKNLNFDERKEIKSMVIDNKMVNFAFQISLRNVKDTPGIYQTDVALSWKEDAKDIRLSRSAYLIAYSPVKK